MPLYEFVCQECDCEQELLVRGEEAPCCEQCGSSRLTKLLSVPAAHSSTASRGSGSDRPPPGPCGPSCGCIG